MDSRELYRKLCQEDASIPLFLRSWWLDATCGMDDWDVAVVANGNRVQAALPFRLRRRFGFRILSQPPLTPFLGPWLRETNAKKAHTYSRQKELMTALIDRLPPYDHYVQNWSPTVTNWLPFHWRGFSQSTAYTYVLEGLADEDELWRRMKENIRTDIRKAENRHRIIVEIEAPLHEFLTLNRLTFSRQGRQPSYSDDYVRRLDQACASRGCRQILIARDQDGRAHAGVYIVWDQTSAYYLMGGGDPDLRSSGATSLCLLHAIRLASRVCPRFDFEGSMIEPVERFFRAFGAEQVPYFRVSRTQSRLLRGALALKSWLDEG
jgi:lipid II:glycine glycyltransferase (peptidoglycan interpeptide bridge formation enzyme)